MKQCLKNGIAVQGYDTVEFFNGKAIQGSDNYSSEYQGAKYLFSSAENKEKFDKDPELFCPQYGGFCSMAMTKGQELRPNPKCFTVENGKLYFFTRLFFGLLDAKKQWIKDPDDKRSTADEAYKNMNP
jgi:YHS domain-containing protein